MTYQNSKLKRLKIILKNLKSVVVAYSGGLDSTFLLKAALDTLGKDNVLAVTARSETYPYSEYREAKSIAKRLDGRHFTINTKELNIKGFSSNPVNRCYYCKKELFKKLDGIRKRYGMGYVVDGANLDDLKDVRFGMKAAKELGVRSPLLEAKLTKFDIRRFSKELKLPTHDKPSFACLASRVPFNQTIKKGILSNIERGEEFVKSLGIKQVRLRAHGKIARLEVSKEDFWKIIKFKDVITKRLKRLGFVYVSLDLEGYRTGSMHEVI